MFEVIELAGMKTVAQTKSAATNHVYVVDVSGSMYNSLPKMRQNLKNIVSMVAKPDDTFSIIYFSGRGQCGVVCENVPVRDLSSVSAVQQAIDRWLTTIGLTGFTEPLKLSIDLASRLDKGKFNNFVMLTDGYDNQSSKNDILETVKLLPTVFSSVSFIEYGWYCDRDLLAKMAELAGGIHIFAEDYTNYEQAFNASISGAVREPKITVTVNKKANHAIYLNNNEIYIVEVVDGEVSVPESVERVHSIVPKDVLQKQLSEDHLYLILYYAAKTNNSKLVWRCLEALGDVRLIDQYTNAFTRQELSEFEVSSHDAVLDKTQRFTKGKDSNYLPKEDAPTVLDALNVLNDNDVQIVVDSKYFVYTRTTRGKEAKEELPKFIVTPGQMSKMTDLVYHSSRPNVSVQTVLKGTVQLPDNEFNLKMVPSTQFKNYTIIRDGILNVKSLPVVVDNAVAETLSQMHPELVEMISFMGEQNQKQYVVLHLSKLPVINRKMSKQVDLEKFKSIITDMNELQGYVKGLKACLSEKDTKSDGLASQYGEDAAKWLSSIGVRDYGFSPLVKTTESTDFYYSMELEYKIKGLSSLPSANAVQKKIDAKKNLTLSENLVWTGMKNGVSLDDKVIKEYIKNATILIRQNQFELSQIVYQIVLGKTWFDGIDDEVVETTLSFDAGNYKPNVGIQLVRKEVKI